MTTKNIKAVLVPGDLDSTPRAIEVTINADPEAYNFPAFREVAGLGTITYMPRDAYGDGIEVMADDEGIYKFGRPNPHKHVIDRLGIMQGAYPFGPVLVVRESVDEEGYSHYESLTDDEVAAFLAPAE